MFGFVLVLSLKTGRRKDLKRVRKTRGKSCWWRWRWRRLKLGIRKGHGILKKQRSHIAMCKAMPLSSDATRNNNRAIASDWELLSVSVDFLVGRGPHVVSSYVLRKRNLFTKWMCMAVCFFLFKCLCLRQTAMYISKALFCTTPIFVFFCPLFGH